MDVFAGLSTSMNSPGPSARVTPDGARRPRAPVTYYDAHNYQTVQNASSGAQSGNYYFNPNSFSNARLIALNQAALTDAAALVGQFSYGTLGRNALRGPGGSTPTWRCRSTSSCSERSSTPSSRRRLQPFQ